MSHAIQLPHSAPAPVHAWRRCREALARVIRERSEEWMVKRTIQSLDALDDRTLKDIGITRSEIESLRPMGEAKSPFVLTSAH